MGFLMLLLTQAAELEGALPQDLPRMSLAEWEPPGHHAAEEHLGVDGYALYTKWDGGLRMKEGWGFGGDLKLSLDWGTAVQLGIKLGYIRWLTDNDPQETFPAESKIRQYRIGVGADFGTEKVDFGVYVLSGLYHFHSVITDYTNPFFELQGAILYKPARQVKFGITGMVDFVRSRYNRAADHLFTNGSVGPMLELSF